MNDLDIPGITIRQAPNLLIGKPLFAEGRQEGVTAIDPAHPPPASQSGSQSRECCNKSVTNEPEIRSDGIIPGFWHPSQHRSKGWLANGRDEPADCLHGTFRNRACFLIGGGPSLKTQDLSILDRRGVMMAAMNAVAGNPEIRIRPHLWFSVDQLSNFHPSIFSDPAVMKFIRHSWRVKPTRRADRDDELKRGGPQARKHPRCYFYDYKFDSFTGSNFLTRPKPPWGYEWSRGRGDRNKTRSVMFSAIYILYWLGFRTIFLLGVDLKMKPGKEYAWNAGIKSGSGYSAGNNLSFDGLLRFFAKTKLHFEDSGLRIHNCSAASRLTLYPRIALRDAVEYMAERSPEPTRVKGLYS